jgi:two-component system, chemotaxis family, chemotaxis protein CheY
MDSNTGRVLIIEDNSVVQAALTGIIRQDSGLRLLGGAGTGEAGLEAVKSLQPDIVCLDVLLPGIEGLAVLREIRKNPPKTRVVMITGNATSDVVKEALKLAAQGFVVNRLMRRRFLPQYMRRFVHGRLPHRCCRL